MCTQLSFVTVISRNLTHSHIFYICYDTIHCIHDTWTQTWFTSLSVILVGNVCNAESSSCLILTVSWSLSEDVWYVSLLELGSDLMKSVITCNIMTIQSLWQQCLLNWDVMQHSLVVTDVLGQPIGPIFEGEDGIDSLSRNIRT